MFVDPIVDLHELQFLVNEDIRPYKVTVLTSVAEDNYDTLAMSLKPTKRIDANPLGFEEIGEIYMNTDPKPTENIFGGMQTAGREVRTLKLERRKHESLPGKMHLLKL